MVIANPHFCLNVEEAGLSLKKIKNLEAENYYCFTMVGNSLNNWVLLKIGAVFKQLFLMCLKYLLRVVTASLIQKKPNFLQFGQAKVGEYNLWNEFL